MEQIYRVVVLRTLFVGSIIRFFVMTCVLAHWLACTWAFVGQRDEEATPTWHARLPESLLPHSFGAAQYEHALQLYGVCIYTALTNIFGGACEIYPMHWSEYFVQAAMMLCGSCVWAYVIGSGCGILATLNPALLEYRQQMDELNVFVREHEMPTEIRVRLRGYFRNTLPLIRLKRYDHLLSKMSTRLRGDASLVVAKHAFRSVSYLAHPDVETEFLCHVTARVVVSIFSRLENIQVSGRIFIVDRGVIARAGKVCLVGTCLGEDMIIALEWLRKPVTAIALTFTQAIIVPRESLFEVLPDFPQAYRVIRRAAYRFALRRYVVKAAELMAQEQEDGQSASGEGHMTQINVLSPGLKSKGAKSLSAMNVKADVGDALVAMRKKQKEIEGNLSKLSVASLNLLKPVSFSPFMNQNVAPLAAPSAVTSTIIKDDGAVLPKDEGMREMAIQLADQGNAISVLQTQLGGVDLKLGAMQKHLEALVARTVPRQKTLKPSQSRGRLARHPSSSSGVAEGAVAHAERQELRDAEGAMTAMCGQTNAPSGALRSTPFEA